MPANTDDGRPNNLEVENENATRGSDGQPPRPATEPEGSEGSSNSKKTVTDPATGAS